jgi:hypothetical protein
VRSETNHSPPTVNEIVPKRSRSAASLAGRSGGGAVATLYLSYRRSALG